MAEKSRITGIVLVVILGVVFVGGVIGLAVAKPEVFGLPAKSVAAAETPPPDPADPAPAATVATEAAGTDAAGTEASSTPSTPPAPVAA